VHAARPIRAYTIIIIIIICRTGRAYNPRSPLSRTDATAAPSHGYWTAADRAPAVPGRPENELSALFFSPRPFLLLSSLSFPSLADAFHTRRTLFIP